MRRWRAWVLAVVWTSVDFRAIAITTHFCLGRWTPCSARIAKSISCSLAAGLEVTAARALGSRRRKGWRSRWGARRSPCHHCLPCRRPHRASRRSRLAMRVAAVFGQRRWRISNLGPHHRCVMRQVCMSVSQTRSMRAWWFFHARKSPAFHCPRKFVQGFRSRCHLPLACGMHGSRPMKQRVTHGRRKFRSRFTSSRRTSHRRNPGIPPSGLIPGLPLDVAAAARVRACRSSLAIEHQARSGEHVRAIGGLV